MQFRAGSMAASAMCARHATYPHDVWGLAPEVDQPLVVAANRNGMPQLQRKGEVLTLDL